MSSADPLECALDLMRRLPPARVEDNLAALIDSAPALADELLARVDQPLVVASDPSARRSFLLCDYNRDGDSFRSPWTNAYYPPIEDGAPGIAPSPPLRRLEEEANEVFDAYR